MTFINDFDTIIQSDEFAREYEDWVAWCEEMEEFYESKEI